MSDTDSFIEEVSEEVRRDRLYGLLKKYGWIAAVVVVGIVGSAAYNEWQKAQTTATAQKLGDDVVAALEQGDTAARAAALDGIETSSAGATALLSMLRASELAEGGDAAGAVALLDQVASNGEVPPIYRQIAAFKSLLVQGEKLDIAERRVRLEGLMQTSAALRLPAEEQLALLDISEGKTQDAIERLQRILADAEVTGDLRRRASQLIVALGGEMEPAGQTGE